MSTKAYREAYRFMTDEQKEAMCELFDKGINLEDGHVYVTYSDVEDTVANIVMATKDKTNMPG